MTFQAIEVKAPEDRRALQMHDLRDPSLTHSNLVAGQCVCRVSDVWGGPEPINGAEPERFDHPTLGSIKDQPFKFDNNTGDACVSCGSTDMYRTGSCMTCHSCGASGGCA